MTYYFAYGSNLNTQQMITRCPGVVFIRTATLKRYRLIFDRHASIEYTGNPEDKVYGVIYSLTATDEKNLDIYEGVSSNVYIKQYLTLSVFNEKVKVLTYIKNTVTRNLPEKYYLDKIKAGYRFYGFPLSVLKDVKVHTFVPKPFSQLKHNKEYIPTYKSTNNHISTFNTKNNNYNQLQNEKEDIDLLLYNSARERTSYTWAD